MLEYIAHLQENPALRGKIFAKPFDIKMDMNGYTHADYISVGAEHVKQSFTMHGFNENQIFVNNYGFDSSQFHPTKLEADNYDLIFVGQWSYRKGCDLITEVCERTKYRFIHIGSVVDLPFPVGIKNMHHLDPMPQHELIEYYKQARVFILSSREEELALVQVQAVACGLPLVCSPFSGGKDLKKYVDDTSFIIELDELKADILVEK